MFWHVVVGIITVLIASCGCTLCIQEGRNHNNWLLYVIAAGCALLDASVVLQRPLSDDPTGIHPLVTNIVTYFGPISMMELLSGGIILIGGILALLFEPVAAARSLETEVPQTSDQPHSTSDG